jgi:hypothetical protein
VAGQRGDALDHAHEVRAAVGARERVHLVDDDHAQVGEQRGGVDPLADQHDLERLGGGHEQLGGLLQEARAIARADVAVPHGAVEADHLGVAAEAVRLVVQQRLDRGQVQRADAVGRAGEQLRQHREHRRFGLAARGGREDDRVVPVQQRGPGLFLHGAQARPAEPGDDGLLQARVQPREGRRHRRLPDLLFGDGRVVVVFAGEGAAGARDVFRVHRHPFDGEGL